MPANAARRTKILALDVCEHYENSAIERFDGQWEFSFHYEDDTGYSLRSGESCPMDECGHVCRVIELDLGPDPAETLWGAACGAEELNEHDEAGLLRDAATALRPSAPERKRWEKPDELA